VIPVSEQSNYRLDVTSLTWVRRPKQTASCATTHRATGLSDGRINFFQDQSTVLFNEEMPAGNPMNLATASGKASPLV